MTGMTYYLKKTKQNLTHTERKNTEEVESTMQRLEDVLLRKHPKANNY